MAVTGLRDDGGSGDAVTPDDLVRELNRDPKWVRRRLRYHQDRGLVSKGDRWSIDRELANKVRQDARESSGGRPTTEFRFRDEPE